METITRTIDLSRAIIDVLNKDTSIRSLTEEILEWLGRERIDKHEYLYCIGALKSLAFPNERGLEMRHRVQSSEGKVLSVSGLKLKLSSSIGRWMLHDLDLIYVVTTVATCMMYHDMAYAIEVLCNMAQDHSRTGNDTSYRYNLYRVRLKPVITKFVDSIALNIVNAGHDFRSALPDALKSICNHPLEAPVLSAIIMAVSQAQSDMIITSDLFPGDLAMWLLTHYHGALEISVNGTIVFEEQTGTSSWRVLLVIYNNECSIDPSPCQDFKRSNIKVATKIKGTLFTLIDENHCFHHVAEPSTRQRLYGTDLLADHRRGLLSRNETAQLRIAAKSMLLWLLQLRICISHQNSLFLISEQGVHNQEDVSDFTKYTNRTTSFEMMLACYPTMLHKNWGEIGGEYCRAIYEPPQYHQEFKREEEVQKAPDDYDSIPHHKRSMSIAEILDCFPMAMSVFDLVQQRCKCGMCKSGKAVGSGSLGCLREAALDELLLLIAHGIAEAFGARDVSGVWNPNVVRDAFREVFEDIIKNWTLQWDRWFRLVALVHFGGSFKKIPSWLEQTSREDRHTSGVVAYQRGSLVMAAAWLNLTSDLSTCPAFKAEFGEGQIHGVCSEEAEVESERAMSLNATFNPDASALNTPISEDLKEWESGIGLVDSALISTGEGVYRLLSMVRSSSHRRIIDPFDAILGLLRSRYPKCAHAHSPVSPRLPHGKELRLATFDHVVGTWNLNGADVDYLPEWRPNTIQVTQLLDTSTKFNVALSLSPNGAVIVESCCLSCACDEVDRIEAPPRVIRRASCDLKAIQKLKTSPTQGS